MGKSPHALSQFRLLGDESSEERSKWEDLYLDQARKRLS
jgi:hypothetical protein